MNNLTFLEVFRPSTDGSYSIYFPDLPGCVGVGRDLEEATRIAKEAASLYIYNMECDNKKISVPSVCLPEKDTEGNLIMPITIYPGLFRMKKDNKRVKTNITLPVWLKRIVEEQQVNYSRFLEAALIDYLQIPIPDRQMSL